MIVLGSATRSSLTCSKARNSSTSRRQLGMCIKGVDTCGAMTVGCWPGCRRMARHMATKLSPVAEEGIPWTSALASGTGHHVACLVDVTYSASGAVFAESSWMWASTNRISASGGEGAMICQVRACLRQAWVEGMEVGGRDKLIAILTGGWPG